MFFADFRQKKKKPIQKNEFLFMTSIHLMTAVVYLMTTTKNAVQLGLVMWVGTSTYDRNDLRLEIQAQLRL